MNLKENKILDKAYVIAKTVMSQQDFYLSEDCNANHKHLLEIMIGDAIWYLTQIKGLWKSDISIWALKNNYKIVEIAGDEPKRIGGEKKMRIIYNGFCILRMIKRAIFS